ncbi:hypothetical protein KHP11_29215 [Rhodococcus erythropolis]|uniref:hypothetical protein n=1 Tax=Rhodococcus erythropolis TaxID=1833 RepID=UPI0008A1280A|nr:hypothetical protein [Rhodococcus erythropolis]MBT1258539.1 hypothetical protein [Rhodococcus erythropolis]OHF24835.1 hypothetical protein BKP30_27725 [Rhodococcus erythropolis]
MNRPFSEQWKNLETPLSREEGRVLSQVLAGGNLVGRDITPAEVEALAAYIARRIDRVEYQRRVTKVRQTTNRNDLGYNQIGNSTRR